MKTLVLGSQPVVEDWLKRRQALGQAGRDEVWEGVYHVAPHASTEHASVAYQVIACLAPRARDAILYGCSEFNLGREGDYGVPDAGWFDEPPSGMYAPTAAVALEVLSPDDETYDKFGVYASRGVREILVADPSLHLVSCWQLQPAESGCLRVPGSAELEVTMAELESEIRWP